MKNAHCLVVALCVLGVAPIKATDTWKGIASSIQSFPLFKSSTWKNMAKGFGAPPKGYVYSFSVYNDTQAPIYVSTQEIASVMGACMPRPNSWELTTIPPRTHHSEINKKYYFEMAIKSTPKEPVNHMPYQYQSDTLYLQDCIALEKPYSTKHHYFRSYIGKDLENGLWIYKQKAEYLGFSGGSAKKTQDLISLSSNLPSLTIKNSTDKDFYIGYTSQPNIKSMTPSSCQIFTKIQKHSFALYAASSGDSLRPGTIGIFDGATQSFVASYDLGEQGFDGKQYTLELYFNVGEAELQMGMQGLMPGHYDLPISRMRDISPIDCTFWRQGANGKEGLMDLPGTVWAVSIGLEEAIIIPVATSQAVKWTISRPEIGAKGWIYFIYTQTTDQLKAKQFATRFAAGLIGKDVLDAYHTQSKEQIVLAKKHGAAQLVMKDVTNKELISPSLLLQATQGALDMHQGRMYDNLTAIDGYLLGADVFLPLGIGSGEMYYILSPSWVNDNSLPMMAVQNVYATTLSSQAPVDMPVATVIVVSRSVSNIKSQIVQPANGSAVKVMAKKMKKVVPARAAAKVKSKKLKSS